MHVSTRVRLIMLSAAGALGSVAVLGGVALLRAL
jgi:hypothetical protein